MSFSFGLICNDAALLSTAQAAFRADLALESGAPNGWGLAYYQSGQPLLSRQPQAMDGPLDFCKQSEDIRSNLLIAHARGESREPRINDNTQPFRFRSWAFCHVGTLAAFDQIGDGLRSSIPDFMRRNIHGSTDSEVLFHLLLAFLSDAKILDDPLSSGDSVARALRSALLYVERLTRERGANPAPYGCLATNGRVLVAAQRQTPLLVKRNSSYTNLSQGPHDRALSYPHLKAVAVIAGREPQSPGWEMLSANDVLAVDADLSIEQFRFDN